MPTIHVQTLRRRLRGPYAALRREDRRGGRQLERQRGVGVEGSTTAARCREHGGGGELPDRRDDFGLSPRSPSLSAVPQREVRIGEPGHGDRKQIRRALICG